MRKLTFISAFAAALVVAQSDSLAAGDWTWPVRGPVLTAYRNGADPYAAAQHRGIDIGAAVGTEVVAATDGRIVYAGALGSSGLTVAERTSDGRYELSYLHLSAASVSAGQRVAAGTPVGAVGVSGRRSAPQPHLHFGVREADDRHGYLDPLRFLAPPAAAPQPRPLPAPAPLPLPALPLTSPAPLGVSAPGRAGELPAALPAGSPARAPAPAPAPLAWPSPAPFHAAAAAPAAAHIGRRHGASARGHAGSHADAATADRGHARIGSVRSQVPSLGPSGRSPLSATGPSPLATPRSDAHAGGHGGLDLGWLAACAGLVTAAALLAGPRGDRPRTSARTAFATLFRAATRG